MTMQWAAVSPRDRSVVVDLRTFDLMAGTPQDRVLVTCSRNSLSQRTPDGNAGIETTREALITCALAYSSQGSAPLAWRCRTVNHD